VRLGENTDKLPYALKFIAKILFEALQKKFPDSPEKELLKVSIFLKLSGQTMKTDLVEGLKSTKYQYI